MQSFLPRFLYGKRKSQDSETTEATESEHKPPWSKFDDLPLEEKRELYKCGSNYVTLKDVQTWPEYRQENLYAIYRKTGQKRKEPAFDVDDSLNEKISLWQGDITTLEIDAIVNAANNSLLGGGGVDGCIHRAAGSGLRQECAALDGCSTGDAKISSGHKLPAKYVIHTVGPIGKQEKLLKSCYKRCLQLVAKHSIRTVAFCCISTGVYGYPIYDACCVALSTVRKWLEKNADMVDRIIFCVFLGEDLDVYTHLLPRYFPSADKYDQKLESIEQQEDVKPEQQEDANQEQQEDANQEQQEDANKEQQEDANKEQQEDANQEQQEDANLEQQEDANLEQQEDANLEQQEDVNQEGNAVKGKEKDELPESEGEGKAAEKSDKEEETADVEIDDEEIKEGVPDPPKLEKGLDSQEESTAVDNEEQVNENLSPDAADSDMEGKLVDSGEEQSSTKPCGFECTI